MSTPQPLTMAEYAAIRFPESGAPDGDLYDAVLEDSEYGDPDSALWPWLEARTYSANTLIYDLIVEWDAAHRQ